MSSSDVPRRLAVLALLGGLSWSCDDGGLVDPVAESVEGGPVAVMAALDPIRVDIQPRDISLTRSGTVTVYLYSSETFDATGTDHGATFFTVGDDGLAGAANLPANPWHRDYDGDGRTDVVLIYRVTDLVAAGLTTRTKHLRIVNDYDLFVVGVPARRPRIVP